LNIKKSGALLGYLYKKISYDLSTTTLKSFKTNIPKTKSSARLLAVLAVL